jgi:hypothetical protein
MVFTMFSNVGLMRLYNEQGKTQLLSREPHDVFPSNIIPVTEEVRSTDTVQQQMRVRERERERGGALFLRTMSHIPE